MTRLRCSFIGTPVWFTGLAGVRTKQTLELMDAQESPTTRYGKLENRVNRQGQHISPSHTRASTLTGDSGGTPKTQADLGTTPRPEGPNELRKAAPPPQNEQEDSMTQTRIAELAGDRTRSTVKVDWLLVIGLVGLGVGIACLLLDLSPELLNALLALAGM